MQVLNRLKIKLSNQEYFTDKLRSSSIGQKIKVTCMFIRYGLFYVKVRKSKCKPTGVYFAPVSSVLSYKSHNKYNIVM